MSKDLSKDFDLNAGGDDNNPENPNGRSVISWITASLVMSTGDLISAITPGWTQGPGYTENEECW
ncbi:hypothetical protein [Candidatus Stoquefichus sp. SB1]|uniref:hypothetical protein n=1 Tax=Candidatus Stoquefichus sp. SB1 TaxID=1658109 RepID=UPI00067EB2AB|nr:hypothetical protein [Candidatus Stoquefichus sp. SB1]